MKNCSQYLLFVLFALALGMVIGSKIEKGLAPKPEIPNPLVSAGPEGARIDFFFNGDVDAWLELRIRGVVEDFRSKLVLAIERFMKDDSDDTDLLILKARINGDKQTEYRLMMKERWLKDMMVPRPSKGD